MPYLIDGYNLLHAIGLLHKRAGPLGLEKARLGLLGLIRGSYGDEASTVTVVFDAAGAPPGAGERRDYQGIQVRYAVHQEQADDLIEILIEHDSSPQQLSVVSDDHRIQRAARRRRCIVLGCMDYLEELERRRRQPRKPPHQDAEKIEVLSEEEIAEWLSKFGDLDHDPDFKELTDPFNFLKEEE